MEKVTDNDVLMMWFEKLVEAQRNYLGVAKGVICVGTMDTDILISSQHIDDFRKIAEMLGEEVQIDQNRGTKGEYIGYFYRYEEFKVVCLIDNPNYVKEVENNG